jgi:chromosome segregation ATPase
MMIQKIILTLSLAISLSVMVNPAVAGKLYRFPDENGVQTLSRNLPPAASQKGYDILDDQTFRLIEHVEPALTPEQIIELEREIAKQKQLEEEAKRQALIDQEQAVIKQKQLDRQQQEQAINDQNLLASYATEQELIAARDESINHRQLRLTETIEKQSQLKQKQLSLQQQAADQELSGKGISTNLQSRLDNTQQEIENNTDMIKQLNEEIVQLTTQFDADLIRLRELLRAKNNTTVN